MKSVHIVLGCCLMFMAVMVMGVSLHSCKSQKAIEKSVQVDSMSMSAYKEELDSFAFRRLLERYNKHWTMEVLRYHPIYDSVGKVTDTYLESRIQMSHRHGRERDSSGWDVVHLIHKDSTEVSTDKNESVEEKPLANEFKMLIVFMLILFLICLKK